MSNREHLIQLLVDDFKDMFPNYSASEEALLRSKLSVFNDLELNLLVKQTKAYKEHFHRYKMRTSQWLILTLLIISALIALYLNS